MADEHSRAGSTQPSRVKYYVIGYAPDATQEVRVDFAVAAVSDSDPSQVDLKQLPWARVLEIDAEADIDLLNAFIDELPANIRLDPQYINRTIQWENCIRVRVLSPKELVKKDIKDLFLLLPNAELGID
ncbi:MAG: hypothetical protein WA532_10555 [Candidatus Korobacteraceae bacterium]